MSEVLKNPNLVTALLVAVVALSGAIGWLTKSLLESKNDTIRRTEQHGEKVVELSERLITALVQVQGVVSNSNQVTDKMKESVDKLTGKIDQLGSVHEAILRGIKE